MAPDGSLHQESKSFNVVIPNSKGCDSLIQINLKIKNSSSSINTSSCRVYVDPIGNPHYDSDSFSVTIANYLGCDSLISIKLTVIKPNINIISEDTLLTASATQVDYQWYVCSPQWQKIEGATSRTFRPNINGEYAVEITQNNCKDTSNCVTVNKLYVNELNASKIEVYPNPSNGKFTLSFETLSNDKEATLSINDVTGREVYATNLKISKGANQLEINANNIANGLYIAKLKVSGSTIEKRLFRNK
jgi:hypothetical protein